MPTVTPANKNAFVHSSHALLLTLQRSYNSPILPLTYFRRHTIKITGRARPNTVTGSERRPHDMRRDYNGNGGSDRVFLTGDVFCGFVEVVAIQVCGCAAGLNQVHSPRSLSLQVPPLFRACPPVRILHRFSWSYSRAIWIFQRAPIHVATDGTSIDHQKFQIIYEATTKSRASINATPCPTVPHALNGSLPS